MIHSVPKSLSTDRLSLQPISPQDFPHWREFYQTDHSRFVGGPKTSEEAWWKFVQFLGHWQMTGFGYWSVRDHQGTYLGRVGMEQAFDWPEPELGWSFLPAATGKGYATEAANAVLADAWSSLDLTGVVSFIHPDNTASIKVATRMGAKLDTALPYTCPYSDHLVYRHSVREALT